MCECESSNEAYETVPLEIDADLLLTLALEAHRRDITLNALIVEIVNREAAKVLDRYDEEINDDGC